MNKSPKRNNTGMFNVLNLNVYFLLDTLETVKTGIFSILVNFNNDRKFF